MSCPNLISFYYIHIHKNAPTFSHKNKLDAFRGDTFRQAYREVGVIRSALVNCPLLIMTATMTPTMEASIEKLLNVENEPIDHIAVIPDRFTIS